MEIPKNKPKLTDKDSQQLFDQWMGSNMKLALAQTALLTCINENRDDETREWWKSVLILEGQCADLERIMLKAFYVTDG